VAEGSGAASRSELSPNLGHGRDADIHDVRHSKNGPLMTGSGQKAKRGRAAAMSRLHAKPVVSPGPACLLIGDKFLDIRHYFGYIAPANQISLSEGTPAGDAGRQERVRCPRAGLHHLRSRAASGISLPALRPAREVRRCTGTGFSARVTPVATAQGLRPPVGAAVEDRALRPSPRKPGLELSPWDESPSGQSRGGTPAGERARSGGRREPPFPWRVPHPLVRT
jgi:hypothetical protein